LLLALVPSLLSRLARGFVKSKTYALADPLYRIVVGLERFFNRIPMNPYALGLPHHLLDLGIYQFEQKKYEAAENTYRETLQVAEKQCSSDSLMSAFALSELNKSLNMQGKYIESEKIGQRLITVLEKIGPKLGPLKQMLDPALGMVDLCGGLARQGRYAEAEAMGKRAVELLESHEIAGDPKIQLRNLAAALNNLGVVYDEGGKAQEALAAYQRSLGLKLKTHNELDRSVAIAHSNVGYAATNVGDLELATKHLDEARRILVKLKICDDNIWATVLNNIGDVERLKGNFDAAEATLLESFKWREKNLPPTNSHFAEGLLSLSLLYADKNDLERGDAYFKRTIANLEARKPVNNKKLSEALSEYAKFLAKAGRQSQASDVEARATSLAASGEGCLPVTP
jgi:tetratricopeptide (TPR) repeat protein